MCRPPSGELDGAPAQGVSLGAACPATLSCRHRWHEGAPLSALPFHPCKHGSTHQTPSDLLLIRPGPSPHPYVAGAVVRVRGGEHAIAAACRQSAAPCSPRRCFLPWVFLRLAAVPAGKKPCVCSKSQLVAPACCAPDAERPPDSVSVPHSLQIPLDLPRAYTPASIPPRARGRTPGGRGVARKSERCDLRPLAASVISAFLHSHSQGPYGPLCARRAMTEAARRGFESSETRHRGRLLWGLISAPVHFNLSRMRHRVLYLW